MKIIDFHSHILPGIDDGSKNIETTISMLKLCYTNGVEVIVATPHFYADSDRIETFLDRRNKAYEQISQLNLKETPSILLGAEIAFFSGISKAEKISELGMDGSNTILLEMPFCTWDEAIMTEVEALIYKRGFNIIVAHLERYLKIKGNKPMVKRLLELPVTVQINAETLVDGRLKRQALKLFKNGQAHILGSDCHGKHHRVPNLWLGRQVVIDKLGQDILDNIDRKGNELLHIE